MSPKTLRRIVRKEACPAAESRHVFWYRNKCPGGAKQGLSRPGAFTYGVRTGPAKVCKTALRFFAKIALLHFRDVQNSASRKSGSKLPPHSRLEELYTIVESKGAGVKLIRPR